MSEGIVALIIFLLFVVVAVVCYFVVKKMEQNRNHYRNIRTNRRGLTIPPSSREKGV